ncbi:glycerophosphodiesterase GDE1 isoform A [Chlorella sorokiniana]|uniref:glycerophosphodiester phosphodiesterase n=1 Tax=Chlorella sorokiniana TaxID=3076 RepID=A0A2P6TEK0_CHLSO|nr:glycerophosphodiesterase GDE1 isoform A [Chlorella sorokiniana]|eukprot:PRW21071.1 glycerophosphodiesterase GDE1 isoform A [Chlorella sorokiniana]
MAAGSEPEPAGEAANGEPPPPPAAKQQRTFRLEVITASEVTRLAVCGNFQALSWDLGAAYDLKYTEASGNQEGSTVWRSDELTATKLPLRFKFVGNGHRSSPNTRPLIWDSVSRVYDAIPESGLIRCDFEPTPDNSDTGWVTGAGVGAYQLRVGQPPGSTQPLVALEAHLGHTQEEVDVVLVEAKPNDPAVPDGKVLARVGDPSCPTCCTYLLNSQSIESLAFRVDVLSRRDGSLLARCFVEPQTLQALEGTIRAALVTPDLRHAGAFHATFLVVSHLPHPANNLGNLQRTRWVPGGNTLDIGHRGSGASKVQGHNVRENTLLSFQKAALNHSEFIEFDVHVTADGECVVFHDFLVPLRLGTEVVRLPISALTADQLKSPDFTQWMLSPNEDATNKDALDEEKQRRRHALRRNLSSAEDMFRSIFKPQFQGAAACQPPLPPPPGSSSSSESGSTGGGAAASDPGVAAARWFLTDRIATLREAFRRTPKWLGFNIELKYPTTIEVAAMRAVWWSRNHFVDAVLKVVLEEGAGRKVIFSTFDPDCAALLSLKQPRFPVFFLTCGGTKLFQDPRMNSLDAALQFALASQLQGVVAEASSVLGRLHETVETFHRQGLFLYTWGDANNDYGHYMAQREAGIDAIIMDDVEKLAKARKKQASLFATKPLRSPASAQDIERLASGLPSLALDRLSSGLGSMHMVAISPIGSPDNPDLATLASGSLSPHAAAALASLASGSLAPHAATLAPGAAGATATVSLVPLLTVVGDAAGLDGLSK